MAPVRVMRVLVLGLLLPATALASRVFVAAELTLPGVGLTDFMLREEEVRAAIAQQIRVNESSVYLLTTRSGLKLQYEVGFPGAMEANAALGRIQGLPSEPAFSASLKAVFPNLGSISQTPPTEASDFVSITVQGSMLLSGLSNPKAVQAGADSFRTELVRAVPGLKPADVEFRSVKNTEAALVLEYLIVVSQGRLSATVGKLEGLPGDAGFLARLRDIQGWQALSSIATGRIIVQEANSSDSTTVSLSGGAIAGIVIGCIVAVVLSVGLVGLAVRRTHYRFERLGDQSADTLALDDEGDSDLGF